MKVLIVMAAALAATVTSQAASQDYAAYVLTANTVCTVSSACGTVGEGNDTHTSY